ncbi:MAG: NAD(P)/FAD-dependent oxidoreductase [Steroidobacteraceae bacterium]|nr:NAD(P)/FAD-dependent oxidoreductase [Steroidobacteraceae bacterium]
MSPDADALVVGGGPAGSVTAALLARAGWHVVLAEAARFPRDKVCGECLSPGALDWLDALGLGERVVQEAGPALASVGWLDSRRELRAALPDGQGGRHRHGRALGRVRLDELLLGEARALGVEVRQPARVLRVDGVPGDHRCELREAGRATALRIRVVVDARGSRPGGEGPQRDDDLLAFKSRWRDAGPTAGHLPLLSFPGGYGGLVVAERGWTTFALCIGRARLRECRARRPGLAAGAALEAELRSHCPALEAMLGGATRATPWLAWGPVRPGIRAAAPGGPLRVGNAVGECHPLVGEGIAMAIQSAALLASRLVRHGPRAHAGRAAEALRLDYARAWRATFRARLLAAAACGRTAMHPPLARPAGALLQAWPALLAVAARLAGKARPALAPRAAAGAARGLA